MEVEAYSEKDARLLACQINGCAEGQIELSVIREPINMFWGLIKRKGIYKVTIKKIQEKVDKNQAQNNKNGYAEIKDGILKVVNPIDNGRYPSIVAYDPNIDVVVNGRKTKRPIILTVDDIVELKPKMIEPKTYIIVELSEDKMQATLKIHKEKGKKFYVKDCEKDICIRICSDFNEIEPKSATSEECIRALNDANIELQFIDMQAINELIILPMGGSAVVARGIEPINGKRAQIEYFFHEIEEDDLDDVPIVEIGDVLAVKTMPALPGRDGLNVTGELVKTIEIKDEMLRVGEGAILLDNGAKAVASVSGRPVIRNGIICVIPLLVIKGDVNKDTGDIEFDGDIIVKQNIMDNMRVTAIGKVRVFGSVFNAKVFSTEEVNVMGKVIGGKIVAGTDMVNYYCIVPIIKDILKIISTIIDQIQKPEKTSHGMIPYAFKPQQHAIKKYIEEIESTLPLMEDDDAQKVTHLLKNIRESISGTNVLHKFDVTQLINLQNELVEYIKLIKSLCSNNANVILQYAQNAVIQACGNIIVTGEGSYQSNLIAKDTILYKRHTSSVKGGMLIAGKSIEAGVIGSQSGIRTYCRIFNKNGKVNANLYNGTVIKIDDKIQIIKEDFDNDF
jgi:uncharacterized protein (DUF342 family)